MSKPSPEWRTDTLSCPLNKGKLAGVVDLILNMRTCAKQEANLQWRQFYERGWKCFEATSREGWTRSWVANKMLTTSHAQMVMSQVAGSLQGYMGNVQNTYRDMVSGSTLPSNIRHQLHFINRKKAWFWKCDVSLNQLVTVVHPKTKKEKLVERKVKVAPEIRDLAKTLIRKAIATHRKPHFKNFQPQIDQRSCFVQSAHTAEHQLWLNLGLREAGMRIDIPLMTHPLFLSRQNQVDTANKNAPLDNEVVESVFESNHTERSEVSNSPEATPSEPTKKKKKSKKRVRNSHATTHSIAKTIRLILSEDHSHLKVAVATDMRQAFEAGRAEYVARTPYLTLDLGLCTLAATDQGDLLGRDWIDVLTRFDIILTGIARHRQRLGLKVRSERYVYHLNRLRGYLKTEINRIFNRLVELKAPGHFILEALDFKNPRMSRRLNRLIKNFGQGLIKQKLLDLEKRYGITSEFRNPAYTSKQCNGCGYVDSRNRKTQAKFQCKFCNRQCHADVNGSLVVRDRRSVASPLQGSRHRVITTLIEQVSLFNERYPRPRGGPSDPRMTNPYFEDWKDGLRLCGEESFSSSAC